MSESQGYYQRRIAQELIAAKRANCPQAAAAHLELAEIYRILVDADDSPEAGAPKPDESNASSVSR